MKKIRFAYLALIFLSIAILVACNSNSNTLEEGNNEANNQNNESEVNEERYETVSQYDKLIEKAEKELSHNDLEKARDYYEEAMEYEEAEADNIAVKIENLEAFIPLAEEALYDYLLDDNGRDYQVLIHAEDYSHTVGSFEDGTVWACSGEGDNVYEGDFSIFTRERTETKFTEHYLGDIQLNDDRDAIQTTAYDNGQLLVVSQCMSSNGTELSLFRIHGDEMEEVMFESNGTSHETALVTYNQMKDYQPENNRFQTITYFNVDGSYSVDTYIYQPDHNKMVLAERNSYQSIDDEIDQWLNDESYYIP
ncbi:MAG TPA: hypothetical protein VK075_00180 [Pseudogracilibacillus sp.]|nr:hypothetical protein [Pseudogracilibacillus sp.]